MKEIKDLRFAIKDKDELIKKIICSSHCVYEDHVKNLIKDADMNNLTYEQVKLFVQIACYEEDFYILEECFERMQSPLTNTEITSLKKKMHTKEKRLLNN